jgi:hypothetical protein
MAPDVESFAPRLDRLICRHRPVEEERSILWTKPRLEKTA